MAVNSGSLETYKYDFNNRVYDETLAAGAQHNTLSYSSNNTTVVTDGLGSVRTYQFAEEVAPPI